jgi:hypothetical protein
LASQDPLLQITSLSILNRGIDQWQMATSTQEINANVPSSSAADVYTGLDIMENHKEKSEAIRCQAVYHDVLVSPSNGNTCTLQGQQEANEVCRVCQCTDPDKSGESALKSLGISVPLHAVYKKRSEQIDRVNIGKNKLVIDIAPSPTVSDQVNFQLAKSGSPLDCLIELGCACKGDLALAHYACALRWFLSRGSTICEICGKLCSNIKLADRDKIISNIRDRCRHNQSPMNGEPSSSNTRSILREAVDHTVTWFDPNGNLSSDLSRNITEAMVGAPPEGLLNSVSPATKWAVEGTGILIATGLLTVTITWLFGSKMNKVCLYSLSVHPFY